jgi:hypothetical protein
MKRQQPPATLCINGEHSPRGFRVGFRERIVDMPQNEFEFLLEMIAAAYEDPELRYLYKRDCLTTNGDPEMTAQYARRVRVRLQDQEAVETGKRSYRLACDASHIAVTGINKLGGKLISPPVLDRLLRAMNHKSS